MTDVCIFSCIRSYTSLSAAMTPEAEMNLYMVALSIVGVGIRVCFLFLRIIGFLFLVFAFDFRRVLKKRIFFRVFREEKGFFFAEGNN